MGSWCSLHHCTPHTFDHFLNTTPAIDTQGDGVGPCNVPQYNFDMCHDAVQNVQVTSSNPSPGGRSIQPKTLLHGRDLELLPRMAI
jgi:hypothetical protein